MTEQADVSQTASVWQGRSIVLVGHMGAGKTTIGRRLAARLGLPFCDADAEIEKAAGLTIAEIFKRYGEPSFREGESRVIHRLLSGAPMVVATGGGAFMNENTRAIIAQRAVSVWLKASIDVLMRRVERRGERPLLATGNPRETMERLLQVRGPVYALADLSVETGDGPHETAVEQIIDQLKRWAEAHPIS